MTNLQASRHTHAVTAGVSAETPEAVACHRDPFRQPSPSPRPPDVLLPVALMEGQYIFPGERGVLQEDF